MSDGILPITIIIPCFNDGQTLFEALESALEASVRQVLVVDDGSTDPMTQLILRELEDPRVTVLRMENGGVAAARTFALSIVETPFVFNLDADDVLMPGALTILRDVMAGDQGCHVAWGDYQVFGEWNHRQQTADGIDPWQLTLINDLPASALFRTDSLRRAGAWRATGYEDWDLWMTFAELGFAGRRMPITTYRYRTRDSNLRQRQKDELHHRALLAEMRSRHSTLFCSRIRAWRGSSTPWAVRLALPVVALLPITGRRRTTAYWRTTQLVSGRLHRRRHS